MTRYRTRYPDPSVILPLMGPVPGIEKNGVHVYFAISILDMDIEI